MICVVVLPSSWFVEYECMFHFCARCRGDSQDGVVNIILSFSPLFVVFNVIGFSVEFNMSGRFTG